MSRSKWKGKFISNVFLKKTLKKQKKIWSRSSTITADFIGQTISVYNGKEFKNIYITRNKIGFKFGQFIFTRKYTQKYKLNKNNIKNLKTKKK